MSNSTRILVTEIDHSNPEETQRIHTIRIDEEHADFYRQYVWMFEDRLHVRSDMAHMNLISCSGGFKTFFTI